MAKKPFIKFETRDDFEIILKSHTERTRIQALAEAEKEFVKKQFNLRVQALVDSQKVLATVAETISRVASAVENIVRWH